MGDIRTSADATFRDYELDGVPASGAHEPIKSDIRATLGVVEDRIDEVEAVSTVGLRWTTNIIRVRSTANVDLATGLENADALNGVTLVTGDHVFLGDQTNPAENGVYTVAAAGAASRAAFADTAAELAHFAFRVSEGAVGTGETWTLPLDAADITLGTTPLLFAPTAMDNASVRVGANIAAGPEAGGSFTTGVDNIALGEMALRDAEDGSQMVAVGRAAGRANVSGTGSVYVGYGAGALHPDGDGNVVIGADAMGNSATGGDFNVAVGSQALTAYAGDENTGVGHKALFEATGIRNTALGAFAGSALTSAQFCTMVGWNAGGGGVGQVATGQNMTALGYNAYTTADNQVALGNDLVEDVRACGIVMFRGYTSNRNYFFAGAGNRASGNLVGYGANIGIGEVALANLTQGDHNLAIGEFAMNALTTSVGSVAIGPNAMEKSNGVDCVLIGWEAGREALGNGVGDTGIGRRSLGKSLQHANNTAVGDSSLWRCQGAGNVGMGYCVAELFAEGDANIFLGRASGRYRKSGERGVFIGEEAGSFHNAPGVDIESNTGAVDAGDRVVAVGYRSLAQTPGADHVGLGDLTGYSLTGGSGSVFLGSGAGNHVNQKVDAVNSVALGTGTYTTADNQVVIGNSDVDEFVFGGVTVTKAQLQALLALVA